LPNITANCGGLWDKKIKDKGINGQDGENPLSFYLLSFYHSATVLVADPGAGLIKYTAEEFLKGWLSSLTP
jgi:hypothetical protein